MKGLKNKAFTLIELLAVIVILAIIALIVTPVVSNIVANARIAANARSVEGHIRNIELAIISRAFRGETTGDTDAFDTIIEGSIIESSLSKPDNDNVTCTIYIIKHGKVISALDCKTSDNSWDKKYSYSVSEGAYVFEFNGTFVAPSDGEKHKGIVYIDPTNPKAVCNSSSEVTTTPSGCKKFYIYDDSGDTYKMINDRNLGDNIAWNSSGSNTSMSTEFTTAIADRTAGWDASGNVRLISADEIAAIVANGTWSSSTATTSDYFYFGSKNATTSYNSQTNAQKAVQQSYHWLFDYTSSCTSDGCQTASNSTNGYFTSSAISGSADYVWSVYRMGKLHNLRATARAFGVRPVLEIPKSIIEG